MPELDCDTGYTLDRAPHPESGLQDGEFQGLKTLNKGDLDVQINEGYT